MEQTMKYQLRSFFLTCFCLFMHSSNASAEPDVTRTQEIETARLPKQAANTMAAARPFGFLAYRRELEAHLLKHGTWKIDGPDLSCGIVASVDDSGRLRAASVSEPSGNGSFDDQVLSLLRKSSPLPVPPTVLRDYLKNVTFYFYSGGPVAEPTPRTPADEEAHEVLAQKLREQMKKQQPKPGPLLDRLTYMRALKVRVKELWKWKDPDKTKVCKLLVSIAEDGKVSSVRVGVSSGEKRFDDQARAVVEKASPFPPPPASVAHEFREIVFIFDSKDSE